MSASGRELPVVVITNTIKSMKLTLAIMTMLVIPLASAQLTPEQLKAMAKGDRLPAPTISFDKFRGVYEADLPERIGIPSPTVKMVLDCSETSCKLTLGENSQHYQGHGTVQSGLFERTRRSIAQRFESARLGCINLTGDSEPDGPFACRVEGMPGGVEPVLLVPPGPPGDEISLYPRKQ